MKIEYFLKTHTNTSLSLFKIDTKFKVHYINTMIGVEIIGTLSGNSMLSEYENYLSLKEELSDIKIKFFEAD
jgi:hypothetical protein